MLPDDGKPNEKGTHMAKHYWAKRGNAIAGPHETEESAIAAFQAQYPQGGIIMTGYGSEGPDFNIAWRKDTREAPLFERRGNVIGRPQILDKLPKSAFKVKSWDNFHGLAAQHATRSLAATHGIHIESRFDAAHGARYECIAYANKYERGALINWQCNAPLWRVRLKAAKEGAQGIAAEKRTYMLNAEEHAHAYEFAIGIATSEGLQHVQIEDCVLYDPRMKR